MGIPDIIGGFSFAIKREGYAVNAPIYQLQERLFGKIETV